MDFVCGQPRPDPRRVPAPRCGSPSARVCSRSSSGPCSPSCGSGPIPPLRWLGATYVTIVRNTPLTLRVHLLHLRAAPAGDPLLVLRLRDRGAHRLHVGVRVRGACGRASTPSTRARSRRPGRSGCRSPGARAGRAAPGVPGRHPAADRRAHRAAQEHVDGGGVQRGRGQRASCAGCRTTTPAPRSRCSSPPPSATWSSPPCCSAARGCWRRRSTPSARAATSGCRLGGHRVPAHAGPAARRASSDGRRPVRRAGAPGPAADPRRQRPRRRPGAGAARRPGDLAAGDDGPVPRGLLGAVHRRRGAAHPAAGPGRHAEGGRAGAGAGPRPGRAPGRGPAVAAVAGALAGDRRSSGCSAPSRSCC